MNYRKLLLLLLMPSSLWAQREEINDYLYQLSNAEMLMASVAVTEHNKLMYTGAQGMLHPNAPNKLANEYTLYRLGTYGALFTRITAEQLIAAGKINPYEMVTQYIKKYERKDTVTVQQLLDHATGIGNYLEYSKWDASRESDWNYKNVVDAINDAPQMFAPGKYSRFSYSNTVLLNYVLEEATKQSIEALWDTYVFQPAAVPFHLPVIKPDAASNEAGSFTFNNGAWRGYKSTDGSYYGPSGGVVLQAKDLCRIMAALFNTKFFNPDVVAQYVKETDGEQALKQYTLNNNAFYGWEGAIDGTRIVTVIQPERMRVISICAQGANVDLEQVLANIDLLLDGEAFYDPVLAPRKLKGKEAALYIGEWWSKGKTQKVAITQVDGHLLLDMDGQDPFPIFPSSDRRFSYPNYGVSVTFNNLSGDNYNELMITQGSKKLQFER